jgi:DNA invertase Pin-like site-specific DNA recombinase
MITAVRSNSFGTAPVTAVAYLRKSVVTSTRHVSWEIQEQEIRTLAARHDHTDLEILSDWGRSGRGEKTYLRKGFATVRARIADGDLDGGFLYSYSLSRLARSLAEYSSLAELCRDHEVTIRLVKEGEFDYATPSGRLVVGILALFAQMEAEIAQDRARDVLVARRARGDHIGGVPYGYERDDDGRLRRKASEDPRVVVDAFLEAGSMWGATRLLNARVPQRRGNWMPSHVRAIVEREAPLELPPGSTRGARPFSTSDRPFYRLLRCHCGNIMTPATHPKTPRQSEWLGYFCHVARLQRTHARPYYVSERKVAPFIVAEAALLVTPPDVEAASDAADGQVHALLERRQRVVDNYEDGVIDKASRDAKLTAIAGEIERLSAVTRTARVPSLDFSWPASHVNAVLRSIWEYVQLDENLLPVRAEWRVPEWRAGG